MGKGGNLNQGRKFFFRITDRVGVCESSSERPRRRNRCGGGGGERGESFLRKKAGSFWCLRVFGLPYQGLYIDQPLLLRPGGPVYLYSRLSFIPFVCTTSETALGQVFVDFLPAWRGFGVRGSRLQRRDASWGPSTQDANLLQSLDVSPLLESVNVFVYLLISLLDLANLPLCSQSI